MSVEHTPLAGKRVLVTGGTTGIGRAAVALLAQKGAKVVTFGRHQPELDDSLAHARGQGGDVSGLTADVSKREDIETVFRAVDDSLGGLDVLVANAAISAKPAQDSDDDSWRYAIETDFLGYVACAREAIARMTDGGHIVFIGSITSERKGKGASIYAAAKAAGQVYAETLRKEVQDRNIKVSIVEPGTVGADLRAPQETPEQQRDKIARHEMLYAEEIADAIAYVLEASPRTDIVNLRIEPRLQAV